MKLKSYFSGTVEAAVDLARQELGEDALLVNARPATPETRHLGAYEVVFGLGTASSDAADERNDHHFAAELAQLRREMHRIRIALETRPGGQIQASAKTDPTLGLHGVERAIVALVGPPGAGKTSTLVKLAVHYGVASGRSTRILSADVHRIGASDQLKTLASLIGASCEVLETPQMLLRAIEDSRPDQLVLIDTPGLASSEIDDAGDLASAIASHLAMDTHLVLPASMKWPDMARAAERYLIFRPTKLIFTRLDETGDYAGLVAEAARQSLPISFLCAGQRIPEDIEPATQGRLHELTQAQPVTSQPESIGATA